MLRMELKYLKNHKFMVVVLIVLLFVPAIYACTFLASMWDPYGQLDNLSVAIVNNDQSAKMNGKSINLGQKLTHSLVRSNSLDFKKVTAQKAQHGLKDGKYYAIYTVPRAFSKNATTILTQHPKSMQLKLETSSGHNMTAGKMAVSAGNSIQTKLNGQVSSTYAKVLVSTISKLENGMKQAASGSKQLASGQKKVNIGTQTLNTGIQNLALGSTALESGSKTLGTGINNYVSAVGTVQSGSSQLANGLVKVDSSVPVLNAGMNQLQSGSVQLANGLDETTAGMNKLQLGANSLTEKLNEYQNSTTAIATKSTVLSNNLNTFANELKTQLNTSTGESDQYAQLAALINTIQTTLKGIETSQNSTTSAVSSALASEASKLNLTADQSQKMQDAATQQVNSSNAKQTQELAPLLTQLQNELNKLNNTSPNSSNVTQLTTSLDGITTAASQLAAANNKIATAGMALTAGSQTVAKGISNTLSGTQKLSTGATSLNTGLSNALPQFTKLATVLGTLSDGATTLNNGVTQLNRKGRTLQTGANTITYNIVKLANGAAKLNLGGKALATATQKLGVGSNQLSNKLANATTSLPKLTFNSNQSKDFASPVKVTHKEADTVPNNGTSMAPYMLGVSLYVGALALNLMFDAYTPRKRPNNGFTWWFSKAVIMDGFAILDATIVFAALTMFNGLSPVHSFQTWVMLELTSLAFVSLIMWLNLLLGKAGSFLAMVLLVIQLGGSAGTYPITLSNHFFELIHPYLPMSYVVSGLRQTIMIGNSADIDMFILFILIMIFSLLNIFHFIRLSKRMTQMDLI